MKIDNHIKTKTEKVNFVEQKKHYKLLGKIRLKKGMKLFALNPDTGDIYEIEVVKRKAINPLDKQKVSKSKSLINPNHPIVKALNKKNAVRKFTKMLNQNI